MSQQIRGRDGVVLAVLQPEGWVCALCPVWLQRTSNGSVTDGVTAHWRTCHPERKAC